MVGGCGVLFVERCGTAVRCDVSTTRVCADAARRTGRGRRRIVVSKGGIG